ncbi:metallophosphoesterase [Gillisia sp. M10.2A]|uniref:Metallophosphoesterase n=1 Tax=Gillisia lutea TaxID=2909668 RepID=A0ABS9EFZ1_9FLAO|nr:metallophosphoesterase [Gillisia lutea]MCF4100381.1 metallophosphoesterase [Gillisia lutea]
MKARFFRYLKHLSLTFLVILLIAVPIGLYHGAQLSYGHNPTRLNFDGEGPYAFYKNDSTLLVKYIKGNKEDGFYLDEKEYAAEESIPAKVFFPLDSTSFDFNIDTHFESPKSVYNDENKILAISDIESGFKSFRDFLISNKVIDKKLHWSFGKNHLVLVGDFVDRGFSTTQVLWFIYKLEQEARKQGGNVHFIIGNHELKNMYGDYEASSLKYTFVASMLGKTQAGLYGKKSVLGNWLSSKNTIESINGNIFVHGGLHPDIAELNMSLQQINDYLRSTYYTAPYPKVNKDEKELLISSKTGISWYRGYFKEDLNQDEIERPLKKFNAKTVIVGHTLQYKVKKFYNGKVFGIDVKHSNDYHKNWPDYGSEGLFISGDDYYRVLDKGEKLKL